MRWWTMLCLALVFAPGPARANFPCDEVWGERNAVYHDAGYCLRTRRGIAAFGNAGCRYDDVADVPPSGRDRAKVARIRQEERRNDCPR